MLLIPHCFLLFGFKKETHFFNTRNVQGGVINKSTFWRRKKLRHSVFTTDCFKISSFTFSILLGLKHCFMVQKLWSLCEFPQPQVNFTQIWDENNSTDFSIIDVSHFSARLDHMELKGFKLLLVFVNNHNHYICIFLCLHIYLEM